MALPESPDSVTTTSSSLNSGASSVSQFVSCAYSMDALAAYVRTSPQAGHATSSSEFGTKIRARSKEMALEASKALLELAASIRTMKLPTAAMADLAAATAAAEKAKAALLVGGAAVGPGILRAATAASLLIQVIGYIQQTSAAVEELARLAKFKAPPEFVAHEATVKPVADVVGCPHHLVIDVKPDAEVECPQVVIGVKLDAEIVECPPAPEAPHKVKE